MTVALFGPDPEQVIRWAGLGTPIRHYRQLTEPPIEAWESFDAVLLDLQLLRVGTSGPDVDVPEALRTLQDIAERNRDAFWLVISPPALVDTGHRLARGIAEKVQAGIQGTEVISEPHQVAVVVPVVRAWLDEIARLDAIPIDILQLRAFTRSEMRCVRRLLRDCQAAALSPLGDGQSEAIVVRADCQLDGAAAPPRVIKVGPGDKILREHNNYMEYARNRLGLGRLPHHDTTDIWRAGTAGAASYSFTGDANPRTLAAVMQSGDGCPALHDLWERVLEPWLSMREAATEPIAAFMEPFLGGMTLDDASKRWDDPPAPSEGTWNPIPWLRVIAGRVNDISLPRVIAHGDLHAHNVLVDAANRSWLIDFYHTGRKSGLFDFAYSDVALMLHRVAGQGAAVAVDDQQLLAGEQRYYAGGDPVRPELSVARSAALAVWGEDCAGLLHLARACAALRLLKYETTEKAIAKAVGSLAAARARALRQDWETSPEIAPIIF